MLLINTSERDILQDLFDRAYAGMFAQKFEPCLNELDEACYRNHLGLKCAIGFLIPDQQYDPDLEGFAAKSERIASLVLGDRYMLASAELVAALEMLQYCHDRADEEDSIESKFMDFAYTYKLKLPNSQLYQPDSLSSHAEVI